MDAARGSCRRAARATAATLAQTPTMSSRTSFADLLALAQGGNWRAVVETCSTDTLFCSTVSRHAVPGTGWTLLHQACQDGSFEGARMCISHGAAVSATAKVETEEVTPDVLAERAGHADLATKVRGARAGSLWAPVADPTLLPSSSAWRQASERTAKEAMTVAYGGGSVNIPVGGTYYVDDWDRVLVGWHGTFNPPCGMDGESMIE